MDDVKNICWSDVIKEEHPDAAFDECFFQLLINMHLLKKLTGRTDKPPWIDEELKNCMVERDGAKGVANKSGCTSDWFTYCKFRNYVTNFNK